MRASAQNSGLCAVTQLESYPRPGKAPARRLPAWLGGALVYGGIIVGGVLFAAYGPSEAAFRKAASRIIDAWRDET